ncbi:unnamed protein product [Enterobius vermicularis]|uniref:MTS domain-containing protein n=1 Tax=Enterobius vermicularis TaxID=51028 RepID=A0A0N4V5L9_ENTVE|nr:unnamed protein product [Enterobius vermicularis]
MEGTKYFMRELDLDVFKINICQELESDVGGVVWDSALVASYYIARRSHAWKEKKILELGAGTGVCSIVAASFGAKVVATDTANRLDLIQKNVSLNEEVISLNNGKVNVQELNWSKTLSGSYVFDEIFLIDAFYYVKGVEDLARTLKGIKFSRILCAYEIRDIGEPKTAQRIFFDLIQNEYIVEEIKKDELDPVYCHPDIKIFYLIRKS